MAPPPIGEQSAAAVIARFLKARGVRRVYALCGGHIMPIWMRLDAEGIRLVDVRDERAAVYMAHAEAQLTGTLGVALVTAGPGVTNAMTGIANAHVAKASVLVLSGLPPTPQENRGALQDIVHTELVRSLTRYARTVRHPDLVPQELAEAAARALGEAGEPGPVYLDFPIDTLRADVAVPMQLPDVFVPPAALPAPAHPQAVQAAVDLLWSARRPLFISGRGARDAGPALCALLDRLGAAYLDTGESKGLVPDDHPSVVAAMRGAVMGQADLVITVGRRLDFQLAFGSPAVFGDARFLRIADTAAELRDNRRTARQPARCGRGAGRLRAGAAGHRGRRARHRTRQRRCLAGRPARAAPPAFGQAGAVHEGRAQRPRRPPAPQPRAGCAAPGPAT